MIKRVCIIGGGNLGMALAVEISRNTEAEIRLLTSKYAIFNETITSVDTTKNTSASAKLFCITDDYAMALADVDLIFVTVPAFLVQNVIKNMKITKQTTIILAPGTGGREFHFKNFSDQGHIIAGLDRVPFVARVLEPGKTVVASKKSSIRFSAMQKTDNSFIEILLTQYLNIQSLAISNYLNITFTPSNQILHSTRLYAMLSGKTINDSFDRYIKFYAEWDDISSEILLSVDYELQNICRAYSLSEVIPLKIHYESENVQNLTNKIKSIKSWADINAPFVFKDDKYFVDAESRYFKEDFPYGLLIIKDFAIIADINTPIIDKILNWYSAFFNLDISSNTKNLSLPRNFGLKSIQDIHNYYGF